MNNSILPIVLGCLIATGFSSHFAVAGQADIKAQLNKNIRMEKAVEKEKEQAENALRNLRGSLVETAQKLQKIESGLSETDREIQQVIQQRSYMQSKLTEDKRLSSGLIHALYQVEQMPAYSHYFSGEDKSKVINRLIALRSGVPLLKNRMESLEGEIQELNEIEVQLRSLKQRQKEQDAALRAENKTLKSLVGKRQALVDKTSAEYKSQIQRVAKLRKEAKSVSELVEKLKPAPKPSGLKRTAGHVGLTALSAGEGKFSPIMGQLRYKYGQKDEIGGINNGLIFATQPRATAIAPMQGQVVFAGPFQNFKQLLIIEHNGGYHSLIGGLDDIQVSVGSKLAAGEPVGQIIHENETNGRLYYELRKNGKPINPEGVLKIRQG